MSDVLAYITAGGVIVGVIVTLLNYRASNAARRDAAAAKAAAETASHGIVEIGGKVYDLGKAVDGRLTQLLEANAAKAAVTADLARAEGVHDGERQQRDRASEPQP